MEYAGADVERAPARRDTAACAPEPAPAPAPAPSPSGAAAAIAATMKSVNACFDALLSRPVSAPAAATRDKSDGDLWEVVVRT